MCERDDQDERLLKILGDLEDIGFDESIDTFYDYLKANLSFPCEVTGIEDFRWEEIYVFGPGNQTEYEHLKKNNPSYTDTYMLHKLVRRTDGEWAMCYEEDLGACVRRISDGKEFILGLSELEATDDTSPNAQMLDDYSVWFVNSC